MLVLSASLFWFLGGETFTMYGQGDLWISSVNDLYEYADLVISGKYLKDKRTYGMEGTGTPLTIGEVETETVYKGEPVDDTILVRFYGGTISLREYVSKRPEEAAKKQGFSGVAGALVMARLGNKVTVEFEAAVDAKPQQDYLLFLSYDEEEGVYQVISDAYGMRPLDENREAYDPFSKSYQPFPAFLKEKQQ